MAFHHHDDNPSFSIEVWDNDNAIMLQGVAGHKHNGSLRILPGEDSTQNRRLQSLFYSENHTLQITLQDRSAWLLANDNRVLSVPDLVGKEAVIRGSIGYRWHLLPTTFQIRMANGATVNCGQFKVLSVDGHNVPVCKLDH